MKLNLFTEVPRSISTLTINQKHRIVHRIHAEIKRGDTDVQIDACKGDDVKCPHCGSNHMGKWGRLLACNAIVVKVRIAVVLSQCLNENTAG
jgi:hypothetical protein